jgi:hypothetical protein
MEGEVTVARMSRPISASSAVFPAGGSMFQCRLRMAGAELIGNIGLGSHEYGSRNPLAHGGRIGDINVYGQESNATTWRLAKMNLAIRGIDGKLGPEHADAFHRDLHKDLEADYVLANRLFNMSDWGGDARVAGPVRPA